MKTIAPGLVRLIARLLLLASLTLACGCAQAASTTNNITDTTASTTSSVLGGVESVILYPFRLIGDLFSS